MEASFKNGLLEEGLTTLFADIVELGSTTAQTLELSEMLEEVISSASGSAFLTGVLPRVWYQYRVPVFRFNISVRLKNRQFVSKTFMAKSTKNPD